jgi:protein TonB
MTMTLPAGGYDMTRILDAQTPRRKLSGPATVAVTVSVLVHVGIGAYLATQAFIQPLMIQSGSDVPLDIKMYNPVVPPPPQPDQLPPRPVTVHTLDTPVVQNEVKPLEVAAVKLDTPSTETPVALPTVPQVITTALASIVTPPQPAAARVIRNPSWLQKPTAEQMARIYPERAARLGLKGAATLVCEVLATGSIRNCVVAEEAPAGRGFGEAAMASSSMFKLNPRTIDGQAVEGAKVRIPIVFNLES